MQIERAIANVRTLGPGNRLVIWVNGCNRRCHGCVSPNLQSFNPNNDIDVLRFMSGFDLNEFDGITISGGEPFEQPEDLYVLVEYCKRNGMEDILVYTGYTESELVDKRNPYVDSVLSSIAVLIDGPYICELDDGTDNLKGSGNQRIIVKNKDLQELYHRYHKKKREMQVFYLGKLIVAAGIPDSAFIKSFESNEEV